MRGASAGIERQTVWYVRAIMDGVPANAIVGDTALAIAIPTAHGRVIALLADIWDYAAGRPLRVMTWHVALRDGVYKAINVESTVIAP